MSSKRAAEAHTALNSVRIELAKSFIVVLLIIGLTMWQFHFVYDSILKHPQLNLLIIFTFIGGVIAAFVSGYRLLNEISVLQAMKETHHDFFEMEKLGDDGGVTRLVRAAEPGIMIKRPRLLGEVYRQIMGELLATRTLRVSLAQRTALFESLKEAIVSERSFTTYLTGTLILMGLIGTFIGLMEMVASVGGIVGGLAKAGTGSDEAIKSVIRDLEAPLVGMATGFSASLFGLFGSLSLGLISRFMNAAMLALRQDFEGWLIRIGSLEGQGASSVSGVASSDASVVTLASTLLGAFRTTQGLITRSAEVMKKLGDRQETQTSALSMLVEQVESLSLRQANIFQQMKKLDVISDSVERLREEEILRDRATANRYADGVGRLSQTIDEARGTIVETVGQVAEQHRTTERLVRALELQTTRGFESFGVELNALKSSGEERGRVAIESNAALEKLMRESTRPLDVKTIGDHLSASVDERLAAGFGAVASSFDDSLSRLLVGIEKLGSTQADLADRLAALDRGTDPVAEMRAFGEHIEQGLSQGLGEIARVLDSILIAQATAQKPATPDGIDMPTPVDAPDLSAVSQAVNEAILSRFRRRNGQSDA
ncbi:MAG: hypothetical protein EBT35_03530 [Alphaproteobacteria bacterium]|nr:hypothetical protein [Alphaproteobacteria bacterium]